MDKKELLDKLEEICSKEENIRKILQAKTKDDIKALFEEIGIEFTDEKFDIFKKVYLETIEKLNSMSEEELQNVSGGSFKGTAMGAGLGAAAMGALGAIQGGVFGKKLGDVLTNIQVRPKNLTRSEKLENFGFRATTVALSVALGAALYAPLGAAVAGGVGFVGDGAAAVYRRVKRNEGDGDV